MNLTIPKLRTWHLLGIVAATAAYIAVFQYRWTVEDDGYAAIRRLRSLDASVRAKAAIDVAAIRPRELRAIAPLTEMLFDTDAGARAAAARSLLSIVGGNGVEEARVGPVKAALASVLGDPDPAARLEIVRTLSYLDAEPNVVVPTLLGFTTDQEPFRRGRAISVLSQYARRSEPALTAILAALHDDSPWVRESAVNSLLSVAIHPKVAPEPLLGRIKTALLAMSDDANQPVRLAAINKLRWIDGITKTYDPRILRFLGDPDSEVRKSACSYVATRRHPSKRATEFVPALERTLNDPDSAVRQVSAYALSRLGLDAEPALPSLRALANDPDQDVRKSAAEAIASIEKAAETFRTHTLPEAIAELSYADPITRSLAAGRLEDFGPMASPAIPALTRCLDDREPEVRQAAAGTLGQLGPEAAVALPTLDKLAETDPDDKVRRAATLTRAILRRP